MCRSRSSPRASPGHHCVTCCSLCYGKFPLSPRRTVSNLLPPYTAVVSTASFPLALSGCLPPAPRGAVLVACHDSWRSFRIGLSLSLARYTSASSVPTTLSRIYCAKFSWPGDVFEFLSIVNRCASTLFYSTSLVLLPSTVSFSLSISLSLAPPIAPVRVSSLSTFIQHVFLFFLLLCSPRSLALFRRRRCCLPFSYSSGVYPRRNGRSVSSGTKHNVTRSCVRACLYLAWERVGVREGRRIE